LVGIDNAIAAKDISAEIQFLSSPFLFEKALNKLDLKISAFAEGKILTEDLYKKSSFSINLINLMDYEVKGTTLALKEEIRVRNQFEKQWFKDVAERNGHYKAMKENIDKYFGNEETI
jgi:uncharacterized protein involved in exopolysaccharide biosynthesis